MNTIVEDTLTQFRLFLNTNYEFVLANCAQNYDEFKDNFIQSNWELIVEYRLSFFSKTDIQLVPYGSGADNIGGSSRILGADINTKYRIVCSPKNNKPDTFNSIVPVGDLLFDRFVTLKDGWYFETPLFDYALCYDEERKMLIYHHQDLNWDLKAIIPSSVTPRSIQTNRSLE